MIFPSEPKMTVKVNISAVKFKLSILGATRVQMIDGNYAQNLFVWMMIVWWALETGKIPLI
ncbi:MAG: hypothetical protein ISN29_00075 [Gammaproteobacteria bacterium AqS3]|nr:hypothetical protein [Gammaproteobacteria bacterium AqS3]